MTDNKRPWTSGPWVIERRVRTAINATDGRHIAMVSYFNGPSGIPVEEHEPNARLMAAAPALYEELDDLIDLAKAAMMTANRDGAEYDIDNELAAARAALRAANPDAFDGEGE